MPEGLPKSPEIHEIRVIPIDADPVGRSVQHEAERSLGITGIEGVQVVKIYTFQGIKQAEANELAKVVTDPLTEQNLINNHANGSAHKVRVAYKPGVMNPEAEALMKAAHDSNITPEATDSSSEYTFLGRVSLKDVKRTAEGLLANPTVQHIISQPPATSTYEGSVGQITRVPIQDASEEDLMALSKDKLFLNTTEMQAVQKHFRTLERDPTDAELEIIAAAWSEHCGHKTFNAAIELPDGTLKPPLFQRIKEEARKHFSDKVLSAFHDNSGVMRFYDGHAICGKVETHNSPSAIEPYGGAMTGSGGVFRDIVGTGQGAKTIISNNMFCLAPPDLDTAELPSGTLRPDYLQRQVVRGVGDYGNRMGIPTGNGSLHFHEDFRAKPTVIVGAYGIMPEEYTQKGAPEMGDLIVAVGGRTGRDGIHGATFSSGEMTDQTANVNSSAVQIGNAIEEKRTFDAILAARDSGCIRALTDCGAAGFSSAIGEIAENIGATVDLANALLKYEGLAPWEIFLSESQERMVLAIPAEKLEELTNICTRYNVESAVLGYFDGTHTLTVYYGDQNVAELDYKFLKEGLPARVMRADWQPPEVIEQKPHLPSNSEEWVDRLYAVMSHGNVCSKEAIVRRYDHGVQGGNVVSPFGGKTEEGPNDALVVRPLLDKPYGVVQSHGMNPILNRYDPYEGSKWAIAEAMANFVAVGGDPNEACLINNFIWPFPDEQGMGSLDQSVEAITDMMEALRIPVISGKDSLSSTYRGKDGEVIKIPPVLCMSAFGRIPDVEKTVTVDIKKPGSVLVLVGKQSDGMAGSTYYDVTGGTSAYVPTINAAALRSTLQNVHGAITSGKVLACHDVSEGGIATAVTEMAIGGDCGVSLSVPGDADPEHFLFNETAGCFVLELENEATANELFGESGYQTIGQTHAEGMLVVSSDNQDAYVFSCDITNLKRAWQRQTEELFE